MIFAPETLRASPIRFSSASSISMPLRRFGIAALPAAFVPILLPYISTLPPVILTPLPSALAAQSRVTGRIVQIKAHDAHEVETILGTLRQAGCQPEDLEIGRADLEDVFLEIMQGDPRAAGAPA